MYRNLGSRNSSWKKNYTQKITGSQDIKLQSYGFESGNFGKHVWGFILKSLYIDQIVETLEHGITHKLFKIMRKRTQAEIWINSNVKDSRIKPSNNNKFHINMLRWWWRARICSLIGHAIARLLTIESDLPISWATCQDSLKILLEMKEGVYTSKSEGTWKVIKDRKLSSLHARLAASKWRIGRREWTQEVEKRERGNFGGDRRWSSVARGDFGRGGARWPGMKRAEERAEFVERSSRLGVADEMRWILMNLSIYIYFSFSGFSLAIYSSAYSLSGCIINSHDIFLT